MRVGADLARKLFLGGSILPRLAAIAFIAVCVSQFVAAAVRANEVISSVRIWPAPDYTRVTFESRQLLSYSLGMVKDPARLILDIENADLATVQKEISGKLSANDPYIASVRTGRFKPNVVRVVFDLKAEVKPQIFNLKPVGDYGHRLVLDIYPISPPDPLMALATRADIATPGSPASTNQNLPKTDPVPRLEAKPPAPIVPSSDIQGGTESGTQAPSISTTQHRSTERQGTSVDRLTTVVLDPGHGGEDPGAKGRRGSYEKHVTLAIARRLKILIDAEPGMRAVLTRDGDFFVPLHTRVEKTRGLKADLFVSIHADAFIRPQARGSSVFALSESGATSAAARLLAKRENEADLIGGVNLSTKDRHLAQTLLDLSQTATIQDSIKLARAVLGQLGGVNTLHKSHVEQAGFAVLKAPDIPSILVETAFISNPEEEKRLNDEHYQDKLAQAILRGIKQYFAKNPPVGRPLLAAHIP